MPYRSIAVLPMLAFMGLTACSESEKAPTGQVQGRVEATTLPITSFAVVPHEMSFGMAAAQQQHSAVSVAVGEFSTDAIFRQLASGSLDAESHFLITGVPTGRGRLVVQALNANGSPVGRSIIHGEVAETGVSIVAPIRGETTAQANVFALAGKVIDPAQIATTEIVARISFNVESRAADAAGTAATLNGMAAAVRAAQTAMLQVANGRTTLALTGGSLQQIGLSAVEQYVGRLHAGVDPDTALLQYYEALVSAYAAAGLPLLAQAEAASAASAAGFRVTTQSVARGTIVRGGARHMGVIRFRLAEQVLDALGASAAQIQQVAAARAGMDAEVKLTATGPPVRAGFAQFENAILEVGRPVVAQALGITVDALLDLELALEAANLHTTLRSAVHGAIDGRAIGNAYMTYYGAVTQLITSALTGGGASAAQAEAVAALYVAARSGHGAFID